eukprot:2452661-Pleurochrysis_carterae.AAC.7
MQPTHSSRRSCAAALLGPCRFQRDLGSPAHSRPECAAESRIPHGLSTPRDTGTSTYTRKRCKARRRHPSRVEPFEALPSPSHTASALLTCLFRYDT